MLFQSLRQSSGNRARASWSRVVRSLPGPDRDGFSRVGKGAWLTPDGAVRNLLALNRSATAATSEGGWLVSTTNRLYYLGQNGAVRWTFDLPEGNRRMTAKMLAPDGRIYFERDATVYALDSDLRPATTGWYTLRGNNQRTGQWLPPQTSPARFLGVKRLDDGALELRLTALPGTTNELQRTTDWHTWTPVETFPGTGQPREIRLTPPGTDPSAYYRVRSTEP